MNKFKSSVNATLGRFHTGTVIEIYKHLNPVLNAVVINHVTDIIQADRLHLTVADLNQYWCFFVLGSLTNCYKRLLIVDIKCADCEALLARALHEVPRANTIISNLLNGKCHELNP